MILCGQRMRWQKSFICLTLIASLVQTLTSCAAIETDRTELKRSKVGSKTAPTKVVKANPLVRTTAQNTAPAAKPIAAPASGSATAQLTAALTNSAEASSPPAPNPATAMTTQNSNGTAPSIPPTNSVVAYQFGDSLSNQQASISRSLFAEARISYPVDQKVIGVVLPLSGKSSAVGQRVLRALQMGLGIHQAGTPYRLAVIDSDENSDAGRSPIDSLVKDDKAIAIIGGVVGKTSQQDAQRAQELGVPFLSLSQKSGLTDLGEYVFRNSLTPRMQIEKMLDYVMSQQGMKRFAILYPNDSYGIEYANAFWDEVLIRGGEITGAQTYSTNETDFRYPIQRLIGTYYGEARSEEFKSIQDEIRKSNRKRSKRKEKAEILLPPLVDFDAVFVPDSVKIAGQISAMFAFNDVLNMNFLGPNIWNTSELPRRMGSKVGRVLFADGLSNGKPSPFVVDYQNLFGEAPGLMEIQAYDSGLLLKEILQREPSERKSFALELSSQRQILGSAGIFDTNEGREISRPTFLFSLEKGRIENL